MQNSRKILEIKCRYTYSLRTIGTHIEFPYINTLKTLFFFVCRYIRLRLVRFGLVQPSGNSYAQSSGNSYVQSSSYGPVTSNHPVTSSSFRPSSIQPSGNRLKLKLQPWYLIFNIQIFLVRRNVS